MPEKQDLFLKSCASLRKKTSNRRERLTVSSWNL